MIIKIWQAQYIDWGAPTVGLCYNYLFNNIHFCCYCCRTQRRRNLPAIIAKLRRTQKSGWSSACAKYYVCMETECARRVLQNKTECYLTQKQTNSYMNKLNLFKTRQYLLLLFWCWWNAAWGNSNVSFPVYFLHAEFCPWWTLGVWVRETPFKWPVVSMKGHLWDYLSLIKSWKYFKLSWKVPATGVSGSHSVAWM